MPTTFYPTSAEFMLTGAFGLGLFACLLLHALWTLRRGVKSKGSRLFFWAIVLMTLLEFPRYMELALAGQYDSRVCYSFHILAGTCFFAAFSVVSHQWSGLLSLASYFRIVYGRNALIGSNVMFAIVDAISILMCLLSESLEVYFLSDAFSVITLIEALRNCVYAGFLAYFGISLVCRFSHYSSLSDLPVPLISGGITSGGASAGVDSGTSASSQSQDGGKLFGRAVLRLTVVLVVALLCFALRAGMLIAKIALLHKEYVAQGVVGSMDEGGGGGGGGGAQLPSSPAFPLFGFFFFGLTDFIPRCIPTAAFMLLMARGSSKASSSSSSASSRSHQRAQQRHSEASKVSFFAAGTGTGAGTDGSRGSGSFSGRPSGGSGGSLALGPFSSYDSSYDDFHFVRLAGDEALSRQYLTERGGGGGGRGGRLAQAQDGEDGAGVYVGEGESDHASSYYLYDDDPLSELGPDGVLDGSDSDSDHAHDQSSEGEGDDAGDVIEEDMVIAMAFQAQSQGRGVGGGGAV